VRKVAERQRRGQRSDGLRSRQAILHQAARLATVEGLDGLSIARLAEAVGMSKSGLYAHFGSKEELQLATIETASVVFDEQVVDAAASARGGLERLRRLTDAFLDHVEARVFPGGCFFASIAAELDTRPGPVRDMALAAMDKWIGLLADAVREAQADGATDASEDPEQLAFEIEGYLLIANAQFVARPDPTPIARARKAVARRLASAGATAA
jgi:AcrR family transcriptional regulator